MVPIKTPDIKFLLQTLLKVKEILLEISVNPDRIYDFDNGLNSGSINIENDSGTFTLNLANDLLLEGPQSIQIELRTGSTSGPIVSTTFIISVNDTSFPQTYKITPDKTNMNEGQTVTYQVETTGVASGTTLYWTNDGAGVTTTGADFTDGYNSGNFIIKLR